MAGLDRQKGATRDPGAAFIAFCRKKYQREKVDREGMALEGHRSPENIRKLSMTYKSPPLRSPGD
jgi:hypothetical protein